MGLCTEAQLQHVEYKTLCAVSCSAVPCVVRDVQSPGWWRVPGWVVLVQIIRGERRRSCPVVLSAMRTTQATRDGNTAQSDLIKTDSGSQDVDVMLPGADRHLSVSLSDQIAVAALWRGWSLTQLTLGTAILASAQMAVGFYF
eukprot:jgi/Ulvmu1/9934/UM058_0017.1